jgi:hypothetical protein
MSMLATIKSIPLSILGLATAAATAPALALAHALNVPALARAAVNGDDAKLPLAGRRPIRAAIGLFAGSERPRGVATL